LQVDVSHTENTTGDQALKTIFFDNLKERESLIRVCCWVSLISNMPSLQPG